MKQETEGDNEFLSPMEKMVYHPLILVLTNLGCLKGLHYSPYTGVVTVNTDGRKRQNLIKLYKLQRVLCSFTEALEQ